jgi:hypothetical protein
MMSIGVAVEVAVLAVALVMAQFEDRQIQMLKRFDDMTRPDDQDVDDPPVAKLEELEARADEQRYVARYEYKLRWALFRRNVCLFVAAVLAAKLIWRIP